MITNSGELDDRIRLLHAVQLPSRHHFFASEKPVCTNTLTCGVVAAKNRRHPLPSNATKHRTHKPKSELDEYSSKTWC